MPAYTYICVGCLFKDEHVFVHNRDEEVNCEICGSIMKRQFPLTFAGKTFPDEGLTLEHVEKNPVHFKSKTEMKAYARDNNLELGALL